MDCWEKMDETALPPQPAFFSKLADSGVSDEDYTHAQQVYDETNKKALGKFKDECGGAKPAHADNAGKIVDLGVWRPLGPPPTLATPQPLIREVARWPR